MCITSQHKARQSLVVKSKACEERGGAYISAQNPLCIHQFIYIYIWLHMQKHYYIPNLAFLSISYQYHIIITFNFKAQLHLKIAYIVHNTVVM